MSKRRINKQQQSRIEKQQSRYREDVIAMDSDRHQQGRVLSRFGRHAEVQCRDETILHCAIRPHIDTLVAGDEVIVESHALHHAVVVSRFPRTTELARTDLRGKLKPVAANVTQVLIVVAPKPQISFALLDSYLVMAHHLGLKACIILNKVDLPCDALQRTLQQIYAPLGYPLLWVSSPHTIGFTELEQCLRGHVSVFVGQSGVGKSSVLAHILPHATIQTGDISKGSELGCHTTSNSRLYALPHGGDVIDSPGVREFGIGQLTPNEIVSGFIEFKPYAAKCQFRNCNHIDAKGCAIKAYVALHPYAQSRYESFLGLMT